MLFVYYLYKYAYIGSKYRISLNFNYSFIINSLYVAAMIRNYIDAIYYYFH